MTTADLVLLGVVLLSGLIALMRGFVREALTIAAWLGAAAAAHALVPFARPIVAGWLPAPEYADYASYAGLFMILMIIFTLIAKAIGGAVRGSAIGGIDRTLGLVFGIARGGALAIAAYFIAGMAVPVDHWPEQVLQSRSLPFVYAGAVWVRGFLPPEYRPPLYQPPPSRQTALDPILNAAPAGRATDPPLRR